MTSVFRVRVDGLSEGEVVGRIKEAVVQKQAITIATLNAEILLSARNDARFRDLLNRCSITVVDGFGPWAFLRLTRNHVARVTGVDLVSTICAVAEEIGARVFFVGGREGSARLSAQRFSRLYPHASIRAIPVQSVERVEEIEEKIRAEGEGPRFVLLAFGAKKQEAFAEALTSTRTADLAIGIGGAFEMLSGTLPRAPKILRVIGLEWLWRLALEPRRLPRILRAVVVFPIFFIYDSFLANHTL